MVLKSRLKIVSIGYDWNKIGRGEYTQTKMKLVRDGLNVNQNIFFLLYAGFTNKRENVNNESIFLVWHFYFFNRIKILYDLCFIFILPILLLIEKFKPDIFYLYDFFHVLVVVVPAKICGSKIYLRLINLPTELALTKGKKGFFYYFYCRITEKLTYLFVDKFIVINETTNKYLSNIGVRQDRIVYDIPDTILKDVDYIKIADPQYIRRKYGFNPDQKIVLSVGSLLKEKGFFELIETFTKLKRGDIVLIIVGVGPEQDKLQNLVKQSKVGERVFFVGKVGREEIWNYFFGSDVFMLFSKSESLGMVFWEAMYANLLVIGTPVGGVKETIGEDWERGLYWNNDLSDLNNKIDFCLSNSDKKSKMLEEAKKFVRERFKLKNNINEIYDADK